jgi:molecular chaperone DnaJ
LIDYYEVLGLEKTASVDEIKQAYRQCAKKFHPDLNPNDKEAELKFKQCSEAFEVLNDPAKKARYDQVGQSNLDRDIFSSFFHSFFRHQTPGDDITISIDLTLEQVYKGLKTEIEYTRTTLCEKCSGKGGPSCQQCNGTKYETLIGGNTHVKRPCTSCQGSGINKKCTECHGNGLGKPLVQKAHIDIPFGMDPNKPLFFKGQGNVSKDGGPTGNLILVANILPHALYERQHQNLLCEIPISYTQLVLGDEIEIVTLDQKLVSFYIPPGTQTGTRFKLHSKGLPYINLQEKTPMLFGDLIVEIKLETPSNMNAEHIAQIEKLSQFDISLDNYPKRKEYKSYVDSHRSES